MSTTYRINKGELLATLAKVKKINDRATKRGFTGHLDVEYTEVEVRTKDIYDMPRTEIFFDTTITGEAPKYNGWVFLAVLDWDAADDVIVKAAPGASTVNRESLKRNWCDHCQTKRGRIKTYVVQHEESGRQVQVGSTCLKDFLGHDAGIVFFSEDDVASDLGMGGMGSGPDTFSTVYVLAIAWALIKLNGYQPAGNFGRTTKGDVLDVLLPPRSMDRERRAELNRIRDLAHEALDRAEECLAWVRSNDFKGDGDYVTNLKTAANSEHIGLGVIGIMASAPQAWAKWQQKTLIQETETKPSNWIGVVDEKLTFTATIHSITYIPGDYGTKTLYTMRTDDGDIVKWFCSGRNDLGDQTKVRVTVKATVKDHTTFRDVKETLVTRAKKVES